MDPVHVSQRSRTGTNMYRTISTGKQPRLSYCPVFCRTLTGSLYYLLEKREHQTQRCQHEDFCNEGQRGDRTAVVAPLRSLCNLLIVAKWHHHLTEIDLPQDYYGIAIVVGTCSCWL
jgi:hypothetical protein